MEKIKYPLEESQIYLLKTIVGEDKHIIENYGKWISSVNLDNYIDAESYGMIPTLYKRLASIGYNDDNMNRYLGIYRKSFYKNSIHFYNLQQVGQRLNETGIPFGILKGTAYTMKYHKDTGIRSMNDLDIFVLKSDIPEAVSILNRIGFHSSTLYDTCENIDLRMSFSFKNQKGFEIDLHWIPDDNSNQFLQMGRTIQHLYKNVDLRLTRAEDSVILLLLHASYSNYTYNIRWIFDLHTILIHENRFDWDQIFNKFADTEYPLVASIMLTAYNKVSSIKVSDDIIKKLATAGNNRTCRLHARKCFIPPKTFLGKLSFYHHCRRHSDKNILIRIITFPSYVLMMSRFETYGEMIKSFTKKYIFRINRSA